MTTEQRKNCSTLNDLCSTVKSLDDRLVSEHTDRVNTELQLQSDLDSKVTQNTNQLRNEFSQEIEAVNNNIKTEVNKAIASVVDEAPESFDTLKEAADWIQAHGTEAAAMQSAITNLENNLTQEALDRTAQLNNKVDKDLSNATGTLSILNGGTGATTANGARNNLLSNVPVETSTPGDDSLFAMYYTNPSDTNGVVYTRKASLIWEYIKGKISSVLGLTSSNYSGTSAKATNDGSGNNIVNTYATKGIFTKQNNSENLFFAFTYTDSLTTAENQEILIQINRLNFNPITLLFLATAYTAENRTPQLIDLGGTYLNSIYIPKFYLDRTNKTFYIEQSTHCIINLKNIYDMSKSIVYTEVESLPSTAVQIEPIKYATKSVATTTQNGLMSSSDKSKLDTLVPVGTIFGGVYSTAPTGYLLCNGSTFNKDTYPALYSVLGTNVLPDLKGKFLQGANGNLKQSIEAGLPNVTGSIGITGGSNDQFLTDNTLANISVDGALYITGTASKKSMANGDSSYTTPTGFGFDASKSNSVYGKSTTVQPPAYTVNYIIKY